MQNNSKFTTEKCTCCLPFVCPIFRIDLKARRTELTRQNFPAIKTDFRKVDFGCRTNESARGPKLTGCQWSGVFSACLHLGYEFLTKGCHKLVLLGIFRYSCDFWKNSVDAKVFLSITSKRMLSHGAMRHGVKFKTSSILLSFVQFSFFLSFCSQV